MPLELALLNDDARMRCHPFAIKGRAAQPAFQMWPFQQLHMFGENALTQGSLQKTGPPIQGATAVSSHKSANQSGSQGGFKNNRITPRGYTTGMQTGQGALGRDATNLFGAIQPVHGARHTIPIVALHFGATTSNRRDADAVTAIGVAAQKAAAIAQDKMPFQAIDASPLAVGNVSIVA